MSTKLIMRLTVSVFVFLLAFAPGLSVPEAKALSLIPIAQDFAPKGQKAIQTFRLVNETDKQVAVVVKAMTREVSIDGKETNKKTSDFLIFPQNVLIGPRQSQVVRVKWRGDVNPAKELAYRIVAEQLPIKRSVAPNARAIQIVVRYVGSLYVVPSGVRPDISVELARAISGSHHKRMLELVLNNMGRAHTLLDDPVLTVMAGGKSQTLKTAQLKGLEGENVLAGSKRRFFIPWPKNLPFERPKVEFKYTPLR